MSRVALLVLMSLFTGCATRPAAVATADAVPEPTVLSLPELVDSVNANNERLPTLYARGYVEAVLYEEKGGGPTTFNGSAIVQHQKPGRLRLKVTKAALGELLDLGTDGERLFVRNGTQRLSYLGTVDQIDPRAAAGLPVRPDLMLQVLGINLLSRDLASFPAPVLEWNPDSRLHMVRFVEPAALGEPRLTVSKQTWYDVTDDGRAIPRQTILTGDDGRPLLVARLFDHEPVGDAGASVARRVYLYFPPTGSKMRIDLEDVQLTQSARRGRTLPNARSFEFVVPPGDRVIDLDLSGEPPPTP